MARKYLSDLSAEEVRDAFDYDPHTGIFKRKSNGTVVAIPASKTYGYVSIKGCGYLLHRLAWLYVFGRWPNQQIDHIDGNTRNNAIANLREVDDTKNHQNTKCKGFTFHAASGKYRALIRVNKKQIHLGAFDDSVSARAAYEAASRRYFGEFSSVHRGMK